MVLNADANWPYFVEEDDAINSTILVTTDDVSFVVNTQVATMLVHNVHTESLRLMDDNEAGADLFVKVHSNHLEKVIDYCEYHAEKVTQEEEDEPCAWDKMFIAALDVRTLFHVAKAANYFQLFGLMELAGKKFTELFPLLLQIGIVNIFDPAFENVLRSTGLGDQILKIVTYELACDIDSYFGLNTRTLVAKASAEDRGVNA